MYKKSAKGWLKHWDFILLDLICLQIAFVMAFMVRHGVGNPYAIPLYRKEAIVLVLMQLIIVFLTENFKNVLKRGYYKEFMAAARQAVFVTLGSTFYLFLVQESKGYSRMTLLMTGMFYLLFGYIVRLLWKKFLFSGSKRFLTTRSLLLVTDSASAEEAIKSILSFNYSGFQLNGLVIIDQDMIGENIANIPVVANKDTLIEYVQKEWVDGVLLHELPDEVKLQMLEECSKMGVTVHICLLDLDNIEGRKQRLERLGGYTVLTTSVTMVPAKQLFYKRLMDLLGAFLGCLLTGILFLFLAPIIYVKSPGPILFSQIRVGRNGKKFKMYKFRSMYMDAEERKKELMSQNQVEDGMMFKMKDDPRIIKGIGHFIRKYSIDEFPQFFNVLKGDMSLVGTRPPTVDEWEKYALHHRVRLAIKPGITGMWQVSGRSDITNFEDVVKLDAKYIDEWSIGLDIKILLKTVGIVFRSDGAM